MKASIVSSCLILLSLGLVGCGTANLNESLGEVQSVSKEMSAESLGLSREQRRHLPEISSYLSSVYQACLLRTPDRQGLAFWLKDIAEQKISAERAFGKICTSTEAKVARAYGFTLGRAPDAQGLANAIKALDEQQITLNQLYASLWESKERKETKGLTEKIKRLKNIIDIHYREALQKMFRLKEKGLS